MLNQYSTKLYREPVFIIDPISNNCFSHAARKKLKGAGSAKLFIPLLKKGQLDDLQAGTEIVFEEITENGRLLSCTGLKEYIVDEGKGLPIYVSDNHNHAYYFWHRERQKGTFHHGATLIHLDQHKDNRAPDMFLSFDQLNSLEHVATYTNSVLNVGNFVTAAVHDGLFVEVINLNSESSLRNFDLGAVRGEVVFDLDLDFFAPEMKYIDFSLTISVLKPIFTRSKLMTIATSPFFIDQSLAMTLLKQIIKKI